MHKNQIEIAKTIQDIAAGLNNAAAQLYKLGIDIPAITISQQPDREFFTWEEFKEILDSSPTYVSRVVKRIKTEGRGRNRLIPLTELDKKVPNFRIKLAKWEESKQSNKVA